MFMTRPPVRERGFTLIEVLVTLVLVLIGLVGLLGLQTRAAGYELESYQRGQAMSLVREMATRIADSRGLVQGGTGYLSNTLSSTDGTLYVGVAGGGTADLGACAVDALAADANLEQARSEMCQWALAIQGAAENAAAGTMLQARGCLIRNAPGNGSLADFYVVVVWQGTVPGKEPLGMQGGEDATPMSQCASAVNFGAGLRRGVSMRVMVPNLVQGA